LHPYTTFFTLYTLPFLLFIHYLLHPSHTTFFTPSTSSLASSISKLQITPCPVATEHWALGVLPRFITAGALRSFLSVSLNLVNLVSLMGTSWSWFVHSTRKNKRPH